MREIEENQYIGNGFSAYGGELEVLLTYQDDKIQNLQVIKHHESEMGQWALDFPAKLLQLIAQTWMVLLGPVQQVGRLKKQPRMHCNRHNKIKHKYNNSEKLEKFYFS